MNHDAFVFDPKGQEIQHLREIIAHNSDWIWEVDAQGRYTFCSEHSRTLLGYTPSQVLGRTPFDFMPPSEAERVGALFAEIVSQRRAFSGLVNRNLRADGRLIVLETSGVPLFDAQGELRGYRGIDRDISPFISPLDQRAVQLEALYAAAPVALALLDREGRFINANHALADLLEAEAVLLSGHLINQWIPAELLDLQACFARLDQNQKIPETILDWRGCNYLLAVREVCAVQGEIIGLTLALTDVTELQRTRQALAKTNHQLAAANALLSELADKDYLTGLPNRRRFDEILLAETTRASRDGSPLALLMLDVDCFKAYNDQYGHQAGDECMRALAKIFQGGLLRAGDVVCRYGGEEFAVILPMSDLDAARHVAERLRRRVFQAGLIHRAAAERRVTVSIGIGMLDSVLHTAAPAQLVRALIKAADHSLYAAKNAGRNRVRQVVA